jgi:hypothetical protein
MHGNKTRPPINCVGPRTFEIVTFLPVNANADDAPSTTTILGFTSLNSSVSHQRRSAMRAEHDAAETRKLIRAAIERRYTAPTGA